MLGGRMAALLDVVSRLPQQVWYEEDSQAGLHPNTGPGLKWSSPKTAVN